MKAFNEEPQVLGEWSTGREKPVISVWNQKMAFPFSKHFWKFEFTVPAWKLRVMNL